MNRVKRIGPVTDQVAVALLAIMVIPTMVYNHYQARAEGTR